MIEMQIFNNDEFDLSVESRGVSFIVRAPGLARGLGFGAAKDMLRTVPDDEKGWEIAPTLGGDQRVWHVTEPGFYRVIGQRHSARIKDEQIRSVVIRFQNWVYRDVLPALRRGSEPIPGVVPITFTFAETAVLLRQHWGLNYGDISLRRVLRSAGVLKQGLDDPMRAYEDWFWFNQSCWQIYPRAVPLLARKIDQNQAQLRRNPFVQTRLDIDGSERELLAG